jgi:ElaA protein
MDPEKIAIKSFLELTTKQLFDIYKLRCDVFIVEQNCAYPEVDDLDLISHHVCMYDNGALVSYCRIIPPQSHRNQTVIGRVVSPKNGRGKGFSKIVMQAAFDFIRATYPLEKTIFIMAQYYLLGFYESLGFIKISDVFLEDGIEHINMEKSI